jgi:hypothetical protein
MTISFSLARFPFRIAKRNALQGNVRTKGIWSGKAQLSSKRKLFVSQPAKEPRRDKVGASLFQLGPKSCFENGTDFILIVDALHPMRPPVWVIFRLPPHLQHLRPNCSAMSYFELLERLKLFLQLHAA